MKTVHLPLLLTILMLPTLLFGCSGGQDQTETQGRDSGVFQAAPKVISKGAKPERSSSELSPPKILLNDEPVELSGGGALQMAVWPDRANYVKFNFNQRLDTSSIADKIEVLPPAAVSELSWPEISVDGNDMTQALFLLQNPHPGETVKIRFKPGIRSKDGRILSEEQQFTVDLTEGTNLKVFLQGSSYQAGGQTTTALEEDLKFPGLLRPGQAKLRFEFSQPVDPERTWNFLREKLAEVQPEITVGPPLWDGPRRILTVPAVPKNFSDPRWSDFQANNYFQISGLFDAEGFKIPEKWVPLAWAAPSTATVFRSPGLPRNGEEAGTVAAVPRLEPLSQHGFRGNSVPAWLNFGEAGDAYKYALLWWDLSKGTYQQLGDTFYSPYLWSDWQGREKVLVGTGRKIMRFDLGTEPGSNLDSPDDFYQPSGDRIILGMAVAFNGQTAVFETEPIEDPWKRNGAVDLVLLDESGKVQQRLQGAADLATGDGFWLPINADWSTDSSTLAIVHRWFGKERSEEGYPKTLNLALSLWKPGETDITDIGTNSLTVGDSVSWRPGTAQVLMMLNRQWRLVTAGETASIGETLPIPENTARIYWSPDGRYLAWQTSWEGEEDSGVLDLQTGEKYQPHGMIPLGWDQESGNLYWFNEK